MSKPAHIEINLIPKDPFLETPFGKLLQWALSVGRYLIIFTELVVILSFASRFNLDRRITDLNTDNFRKQTIIESYGDLEANVRAVQKKTENYLQVEQQENIVDIFPALSEITPPDVVLTELTMQTGKVNLTGIAKSNVSLSLLINNIQVSDKFSDVTVEKIETAKRTNEGLEFRIQANTKRQLPQAVGTGGNR